MTEICQQTDRHSKQQLEVHNANTYFKCAEAAPSKVKVIHIPTADILSNQDVLGKRWEGCLSLPQTQSTYYIEAVEPYTVLS